MSAKIKKVWNLSLLTLIILATIAGYIWFLKSSYFEPTKIWAHQHTVWYFIVLVVIKAAGIVWAPLPGGTLTLISVPIVGWVEAYLADLAGSTLGSFIAYHLGQRYGLNILRKFVSNAAADKIDGMKIRKGREIEAIFMARLTVGTLAVEALSYAAGIMRLNYWKFLVGTTVAHLILGAPLYYLASAWYSSRNVLLSIAIAVLLLPIFFKFRERYFE